MIKKSLRRMRTLLWLSGAALLAAAVMASLAAAAVNVKSEPTASFSGATVTLTGGEFSGLGSVEAIANLTVTGEATYTCENAGGNAAPGQNPVPAEEGSSGPFNLGNSEHNERAPRRPGLKSDLRPQMKLTRSRLATLVVLASAVLAGCGETAQNREARTLENASVLSKTAPLSDRLIKQSDIASASDQAGVRTFLELWSLLQYGAVDQAELLFTPGLRAALGPAVLAQAFDTNLLVWQGTKPQIVSATASGPRASIRFLARDEAGKLLPGSISFRRSEGSWRVAYFSLLNPALQRTVQTRVQAQVEPLATKPSAEAVRQGDSAGALQSVYLERLLRSEARSAKP